MFAGSGHSSCHKLVKLSFRSALPVAKGVPEYVGKIIIVLQPFMGWLAGRGFPEADIFCLCRGRAGQYLPSVRRGRNGG
jgi:hypothetical protein